VNVLIGANGSGKSNLVSFFPLLAAVSLNDVPVFIGRAGGASTVLHFGPKNTREIVCQLEFENARGVRRYDFNLFFSPGDKMLVAGERFVELGFESPANDVVHVAVGCQFFRPWEGGQVPDGEPAHEIHGLVEGIRTFHFHDTSDAAEVRLAHYVEDNKQLLSEAENLAAVLHLLN
jgi:predicted ATPase